MIDLMLARRAAIALSCAALAGFLGGRIFGQPAAHAGTGCPNEPIDWPSTAQDVKDTDDGVDEDNRWNMHGGQDKARSLACDDGTVTILGIDGQDQNDDVGGGSGQDWIGGSANNDDVFGGDSPQFQGDSLYGGDGSDYLADLETDGADVLNGNDGDDTLNADDGDPFDHLNGGQGQDDCTGPGDSRTSCES
jgi:Ca2+-binding RTX toxin-like protein